ncbi:cytochrome P460 family protein [Tundrisphaera lichenicola]|uniref:cytochrome P460 family protein n=1 Tax=Tundrisphaera lichenicola TaxID=2029860 RepID=UPI003EB71261
MFATRISIRSRWIPRIASGLIALGLVSTAWSGPETPPSDAEGPRYAGDGRLVRPPDYREWAFVTSGLGMTYGPAKADDERSPRFDNVFVSRPAYREFLKSGTWPDRTMFILEVRQAQSNVSINNGGRTQGEIVAIEAAVKDRTRYPEGGWAYFSFDGPEGPADSATPLPSSASCYKCHEEKTAVDNTFVQFYPTLFDVAKRHGTVKPTYDPGRKP